MKLALALLCVSLAGGVSGADNARVLSAKELSEARKLYLAKCAKCHKFYDPSSYGGPEWEDWMEKMRKKGRLRERQFDLLLRYTDVLRREAAGSGPIMPVVAEPVEKPKR